MAFLRIFLILLFLTCPAFAETTVKDIMVAVRTIGFIINPPMGKVDLAVIYDPEKPLSVMDRDLVWETIDGGTAVGDNIVRSVAIPISDVKELSNYKFVLITTDLENYIGDINKIINQKGIVSFSTNLNYVKNGQCVLGVVSEPKVQLFLSKINKGIFTIYFRMMTTEIKND